MRILKGHDAIVRCLGYSPDGRLLAAGDEANYIRLWSLPAGEELAVLDRDAGPVETLAFSPSGELLAAGLPEDVVVWDVADRKIRAEKPGHKGGTRGLAWSPDGKVLASCGWDREACFWTDKLAQRRASLKTPEPIMALCCTPDGKELVLAGNNGTLLISSATGKQRAVRKHGRPLFSLAVSPDGRRAASGDAKGDIVLWDLAGESEPRILQGHEWTVYGLAFTSGGQSLLSGSADGTVRLWDVGAGRLVETFRWHSRWVTSVAAAPDGMTAAAGSAEGTIVVWDLADV